VISRSLSRRLEQLEECMMPETVRRVWRVMLLNSDGSVEEVEKIEWQAPRSVQGNAPAFRKRYR
jgi:hypothetical protein